VKQVILICTLVPALGFCIFAQENSTVYGYGMEINLYAPEYVAGGAAFTIEHNFAQSFAMGLSFTASGNGQGHNVVEPALLFRWYFLGRGHTGFFAQADLGASVLSGGGEMRSLLLAGLRGGYRLPLGQLWYVEPYARAGFPFALGIGIMGGLR
jgi:hypothetical protein